MPDRPDLNEERWELLRQLDALLETPMVVLSFAWLVLTVVDLTSGLNRTLEVVSYAIWGLFGLHFLLGVVIAPSRTAYLHRNWLTALALVLPAFRMLRVFRAFRLLRAARAVRSITLVRPITSLNRGMRAVGTAIGRRGVGYVAALTLIATFVGAAGMAQFESPAALREAGHAGAADAGAGLGSYTETLWWTTMVMTTMGSEYWPRTLEGRILGWLLALYAFAVFGYLTATIASFFIGRDATRASPDTDMAGLQADVAALRAQVTRLADLLERHGPSDPDVSSARAREQSQGGALGAHRRRDDGQIEAKERQVAALRPGP